MVMDLEKYKAMVMDLLLNRQWYRPISLAQVKHAQTKYQILVARTFVDGLIDKKVRVHKSKNPQIAYFVCSTKDT